MNAAREEAVSQTRTRNEFSLQFSLWRHNQSANWQSNAIFRELMQKSHNCNRAARYPASPHSARGLSKTAPLSAQLSARFPSASVRTSRGRRRASTQKSSTSCRAICATPRLLTKSQQKVAWLASRERFEEARAISVRTGVPMPEEAPKAPSTAGTAAPVGGGRAWVELAVPAHQRCAATKFFPSFSA